jgi:hypothetical protein
LKTQERITANANLPVLEEAKIDGLINVSEDDVKELINHAYQQIAFGFAFVSNFVIPLSDEENVNRVSVIGSVEYMVQTSYIAMNHLFNDLNQRTLCKIKNRL